jgi:ribosomal protein S18 acetylase RimI-like enzyme
MTAGPVRVRPAERSEAAALKSLLPRLADLDVPPGRAAEDLWRGDAALVDAWARRDRDDLHVLVAEIHSVGLTLAHAGVAVLRMMPEPLSGADAAHLDVLAVALAAEGRGVGSRLVAAAEALAAAEGATCMTLHVINSNARARALYERHGFAAEIVRYIKRF